MLTRVTILCPLFLDQSVNTCYFIRKNSVAMQKNQHWNFRNYFCLWWLLTFNISRFLDSYTHHLHTIILVGQCFVQPSIILSILGPNILITLFQNPRSLCSSLNVRVQVSHLYQIIVLCILICVFDRLCGLVVRVSGYRSRGPGFDSRRFQIFWETAGLERGPLSLVRTTEELLGRKSSGSGLENRD
jgi:hypothetical protein